MKMKRLTYDVFNFFLCIYIISADLFAVYWLDISSFYSYFDDI